MIVAPDAKLGVVAMMASNQSSSDMVAKVGEHVLLRALVDNGTIAEMPAKLPRNPLPVIAPTSEEESTCSGSAMLPGSGEAAYLMFFGTPGATINLRY